jgi:uncharacterized membrane protein YfcA
MTSDFLLLAFVGFLAQLIDGALGMAFGLISTTFMLAVGLPPAHASAIVHTAEIATTAVVGASHVANRNVDRALFLRLAIAGVAGGVLGAYILSNIEGKAIRPLVAAYLLLMGALILMRAARALPLEDARPGYAPPLGLIGGFLDAIGGGGWGPLVTSTLIGSGQAPRKVIGSVSLAEFFVATAIAGTFLAELGTVYLPHVVALGIGGILAAPFAGFVVKRTRPRLLLVAVGLLVTGLAIRDLILVLSR